MLRIYFKLQFIFPFILPLFSTKNYKRLSQNSCQGMDSRMPQLPAIKKHSGREKYAPGGRAGELGESVDKPGSVVDDHSSATGVTTCLKRPTRIHCGSQLTDSYLVLLRVGFTIATPVASRAVRSYRTISPLPSHEWHSNEVRPHFWAVYSLLHFP